MIDGWYGINRVRFLLIGICVSLMSGIILMCYFGDRIRDFGL